MIKWVLNIENHQAILKKVDTILLICLNGVSVGMIDWVKDITDIFKSIPAILLTLTVIVLNLAKAYQIYIDTVIKKKKELGEDE